MDDAAAAQPDEWRHVQCVFENVGNTEAAERYITTVDVVNITNGSIDSTWNDTDYTQCDNGISALCTAALAHMDSNVRCVERRYYRRVFNPLTIAAPFPPSGPPERIIPDSRAGALTPTNGMARQVAMTSTDRTAYPRHWGRNYWPVPSAQTIGPTGQFATITVDTFASALEAAYELLAASEFFPVVVVTQVQKAPVRGLLTTSQVQVDSLPDVVRRRRPRFAAHKLALPAVP